MSDNSLQYNVNMANETSHNKDVKAKITEKIKSESDEDKKAVVEGALVVCTSMLEAQSKSKMKKEDQNSGKVVQKALELVHTDIEFEPLFSGCMFSQDHVCKPEITDSEWQGYDETNESNGGYGLLKDQSFMVCPYGCGLLCITDDGQQLTDDELMALLMRSLKGKSFLCAYGGDPVNLSTGNFIYNHSDIKINGKLPLEFSRFYNSIDSYEGAFGQNWCHSFDIRILLQEDKDVSILFEDGHQEYYVCNELGKFAAPAGNYNKLIRDKYNEYVLTFPNGLSYHFNRKGRITLQKDNNGNEIRFIYEGERLKNVISGNGSLKFEWENDRIITICDHAGRTVQYLYENDILCQYIDTKGNAYQYEYNLLHQLIRVTNPEGFIELENTYDFMNRVVKQTFADGGVMKYSYNEENRTTEFTQQNGSKIIYKRDEQYRTTGIVYPDGEEAFKYNNKNQKELVVDKLGNKTHYSYDEQGNVSEITNALGIKTELCYSTKNQLIKKIIAGKEKIRNSYDEKGNLVLVEDALHQKTIYTYTQDGVPEVIVQPDGSKIQFVYDERRNIVKITDENGVITRYKYDTLNRVIATIDGNGNVTKYQYDSEGNIIEVKNAVGDTRAYTYNKNNKVTKAIDFDGGCIVREYNSLGYPSKVIDQLGRETKWHYDSMWNLSHVVEPNGAEIEFLYNEQNLLESIKKPDGNFIHYQYDANGNKIGITDEEGNQTNFVYDALGQLVEVTGPEGLKVSYDYNEEGQVICATDALGHKVNMVYDENGQLIQETNALGESRCYTYTPLGQIETITDEAGLLTCYHYESGGRLKEICYPDQTKESVTYDANGNIKTYSDDKGQTSEYWYDSLNRVVKITAGNGGEKKYAYDVLGNVVSMIDEYGNKTSYEYTPTGKLFKVIDAMGNQAVYTYDEKDQLIEVCQYGNEDIGMDQELWHANQKNQETERLRITRYERNKIGQVVVAIDALEQREQYRYSPKGQLIEKIDKDGYLTRYGYTAHGDIKYIQYADGREVAFSYNLLRQLTEVEDWLGLTKIENDALGRTIQITDYQNQTVRYTWGSAGERRQMKYPDGRSVSYEYDSFLRLTQVDDGKQKIQYAYDAHSRLTEKIFQDGAKTQYHYNEFGQLRELSHWNHNDKLMDIYLYDYDCAGNQIGVAKKRKQLPEENGYYAYSYDPLYRLTKVTKNHQILREYEYDGYGNRIRMIDANQDNVIVYHYNEQNQLISWMDDFGNNQEFEYDKRGNLSDVYKNGQLTNHYCYGTINRLEGAFNYEKSIGVNYQYNGLGHRIGKIEGKLITAFPALKTGQVEVNPTAKIVDVLDLTKPYQNLLQRREGQKTTSFIWDYNLLSSIQGGGHYHNYFLDSLGSPLSILDDQGIVQAVYGFDEFGNDLYQGDYQGQPFGHTGYQMDAVADTYYAQAREYLSHAGRFISEDFIKGFVHQPYTLNSYNYCWNRPIDFVDWNGLYVYDAADGTEAHTIMQIYMKGVFPNQIEVEVPIPGSSVAGNTGKADIVYNTGNINEVYEIKPGSFTPGAVNNAAGKDQLQRYINGLKAMGKDAKAGTSLNWFINATMLPSIRHPGKWIKYTTYPQDPGMIYWSYINRKQPQCEPVPVPSDVPEKKKNEITGKDVATGVGVAVGAGAAAYGIYRFIRFLPSLAPPLWWTIPGNLAIP